MTLRNTHMFILPREARLIRRIEAEILEVAINFGFEEVLFPRAMAYTDWVEVVKSLGPVSSHLESELVKTSDIGPHPMVFCHWQCEPYYRALRNLGPQTPPRVVDRSGWSYRNEKKLGIFRPREFLRVELVWRGSREEVSEIHENLLHSIQHRLTEMSLATQRIRRGDEETNSGQRLVLDLVATATDGSEVEVVGSHLHADLFVRHFWKDAPSDMETACLGVSLSRIASLLLQRFDSEGSQG